MRGIQLDLLSQDCELEITTSLPNKNGVFCVYGADPSLRTFLFEKEKVRVCIRILRTGAYQYLSAHDYVYSQGGSGHGLSPKWNRHPSMQAAIDYEREKILEYALILKHGGMSEREKKIFSSTLIEWAWGLS